MEIIRGKKSGGITRPELENLLAGYSTVTLDIGTGDGKFVYRLARNRPDWFCIGVDAERANLREISSRITRKPGRGGLPNALFAIAPAENLPPELNGLADRITINFPWGSLLQALVRAKRPFLDGLTRVAARPCVVEAYVNTSIFGDPVPLAVQTLPELTPAYVKEVLAPALAQAGITLVERKTVGKPALEEIASTWSKRLAFGREPDTIYMRMHITAQETQGALSD